MLRSHDHQRASRKPSAHAYAAAYARRPRRTLRSHDHQRASRKLSVYAVALCASRPPLYCPGATRPRQALSRLPSRIRVASYCRRAGLECDLHGTSGGGKHCDDNDAQPCASAAATSTATTTMHSPTAFHTAGVATTCATLARLSIRTTLAKRACSCLALA